MRNLLSVSMVVPLVLGACSTTAAVEPTTGSTGTGGGTATTGGATTGGCALTTVTFTTVDVHPAAKAALTAAGFPITPIANAGYQLYLQGVSLSFAGGQSTIVLADGGYAPITSTGGPYAFALTCDFLDHSALLGVLAGVVPIAAHGLDAGLPQPTCPEFEALRAGVDAYWDAGAGAVVPDFLLDAGFVDYLMPSGLLVGGQAQAPSADVPGAVAYAIPMSYAVMLNCAGAPTKTTRDTDIGEALIYITNGAGPGQGTPVAGAITVLKNPGGNDPPPTYYEDNYMMTDTTGTDSTGTATYVGVVPLATPPTITVEGVPGFTYTASYGISTLPNSFFSIVAYPH